MYAIEAGHIFKIIEVVSQFKIQVKRRPDMAL